MNQRIKNKTYFNLAFVPLLLIIGFLGIEFIDEIDVEYKTDQMFDDRLGYSLLFLFFLAIILLVWLKIAADTCFQARFHKKWLFLNLLSIGWLPFVLTAWYLDQNLPIYIEKKNFKDRIEDQIDIVMANAIDLDTDRPILTSYLFNNNFYILTGEDLSRKASLRLFNQEVLLSPTSKHPIYFKNLKIFKLDEEKFVEHSIKNHPLFDTTYQKNVYRTVFNTRIPTPDSIPSTYYQLNKPDERCSFPLFMSDHSYLYRICDSFKIQVFHKDFTLYKDKPINNEIYNELINGDISNHNNTYWKTESYNYYHEQPNGDLYSFVRPHGHTKNTKEAAFELSIKSNEHHFYIARKKREGSVQIKKVGPFPTVPFIKGLYSTNDKVYVIFNQKLFWIDTF